RLPEKLAAAGADRRRLLHETRDLRGRRAAERCAVPEIPALQGDVGGGAGETRDLARRRGGRGAARGDRLRARRGRRGRGPGVGGARRRAQRRRRGLREGRGGLGEPPGGLDPAFVEPGTRRRRGGGSWGDDPVRDGPLRPRSLRGEAGGRGVTEGGDGVAPGGAPRLLAVAVDENQALARARAGHVEHALLLRLLVASPRPLVPDPGQVRRAVAQADGEVAALPLEPRHLGLPTGG